MQDWSEMVRKSGILLLCVWAMISASALGSMNMFFTNTGSVYSPTNTWVTIQRGQNPALDTTAANVPGIAYGTNQFVWNTYTNVVGGNTQVGCLYAQSVLLSDINAAGGITWTSNAPSAAVYISYGAALPVSSYSISGISVSATPDPSYNIPYQNFELTYYGNSVNDQGDITAINFFTAPISIRSYSSTNAVGTALQTRGFNTDAATIFNQIEQISTGSGTSPLLTNASGAYTRALGPTQFGVGQPNAADFGAYTNLSAYFGSLSNTATVFSNSSGYNTVSVPTTNAPYTNASVVFVLTNRVSATTNGYAFAAAGAITMTKMSYNFVTNSFTNSGNVTYTTNFTATSTNVATYTNVLFSVTPGTNESGLAAAFVYYGGYTASTNITLAGSGWTSFTNDISGFVDGGGNAAAGIVMAQIPGEISTGYDAGLPGSTNVSAQWGNVPLGTLPSSQWWSLTNPPLFSDIQGSPYYNEYANVIYLNSSNTVYGMTYGDRFTDPNSQPYVSAAPGVGSWMIGIGDPIPEPTYALAITLSIIGFALVKTVWKPSTKQAKG